MAGLYSDIGNTSETQDYSAAMMDSVEDSLEDQIEKQLIFGGITFVAKFISIFCWLLLGDRVIYNFKKKYFALLLLLFYPHLIFYNLILSTKFPKF